MSTTSDKPETVAGNVAALREALEWCVFDYETGGIDETSEKWLAEHFGETSALVCWRKAKAALAAPPRNCDMFNTGDPAKDANDAYAAWQTYCDNTSMPPSCRVESAFKNWLFAPAAEWKGMARRERRKVNG